MNLEKQISELRARFFAVRETRPAAHIYFLLDNDCPVAPDHPLHTGQLEKREVKRERAVVGNGSSTLPPEWQPTLIQFYRAGERMQGFLGKAMMVVMPLLFPMWLLFGLGNFIVMKLAPEASWPPGIDEKSRR